MDKYYVATVRILIRRNLMIMYKNEENKEHPPLIVSTILESALESAVFS